MADPVIGIYEKALPDSGDWPARFAVARDAGFGFIEIAVDETEERMARLDWPAAQRADFHRAAVDADIFVQTLILSAHRKYPLGSADPATRAKGLDILRQGIDFAIESGIRLIQLSGYYSFYEDSDAGAEDRFTDSLYRGAEWAAQAGIMLAIENMDGNDVTSVSKAMRFVDLIDSPWLQTYPDLGNLAANGHNVAAELRRARGHLAGIHLKDARPGEYRRVPFGEGVVPFDEAFRALSDIGYSGTFLIEMWNDDAPDAVSTISRARNWIIAKMIEGGFLDSKQGAARHA